jgi:crotonobetainyl-CoA:carnitine CoA-transferase CaiB-like acyl-CoA transferase
MMGPLEGVRVVELGANVAGPFTGLVLRDLGADVVKIENPDAGDVVRGWPPHAGEVSTTFAALNRGKRSVALDLRAEAGRAAMERVLATADVFVESLRPGKADALGFGYKRLSAVNPRLVHCGISGFGSVGPKGGEPGFDAIVQAYSGLMDITGHADGPPARVGTGIVDFGTGVWAAVGVLSALYRREQTGRGGQVEVALLGGAVGFLMHHIASVTMAGVVPQRIGTAQHNSAPYEAIMAADGQVMVGVTSQPLWARICNALGVPELEQDPRFATNADRVRNRERLVPLLSAGVSDLSAADAVERLRAAGVPAAAIRGVDALPGDPQVAALDLVQATADGRRLAVTPARLEGQMPQLGNVTVPELGAHTEAVLREAGLTDAEIAILWEPAAGSVS